MEYLIECNQCGFSKKKELKKHAYRHAGYHEGIEKTHSVKVIEDES